MKIPCICIQTKDTILILTLTIKQSSDTMDEFIFQAIGLCSASARIFGLGCPFVSNLAVYWKPLPMVLLGAPTLVVALLMTRLPETAKKDLPQDFEDGAALNKQPEGNIINNNNINNNNDVVMQEKESKQ